MNNITEAMIHIIIGTIIGLILKIFGYNSGFIMYIFGVCFELLIEIKNNNK